MYQNHFASQLRLSWAEISIKSLAEKILELTNSNSKIIYKDLPKDDPKQRKPDLTKIKNKFDYEPMFSLEEGLKITINWVQKNYK